MAIGFSMWNYQKIMKCLMHSSSNLFMYLYSFSENCRKCDSIWRVMQREKKPIRMNGSLRIILLENLNKLSHFHFNFKITHTQVHCYRWESISCGITIGTHINQPHSTGMNQPLCLCTRIWMLFFLSDYFRSFRWNGMIQLCEWWQCLVAVDSVSMWFSGKSQLVILTCFSELLLFVVLHSFITTWVFLVLASILSSKFRYLSNWQVFPFLVFVGDIALNKW